MLPPSSILQIYRVGRLCNTTTYSWSMPSSWPALKSRPFLDISRDVLSLHRNSADYECESFCGRLHGENVWLLPDYSGFYLHQ